MGNSAPDKTHTAHLADYLTVQNPAEPAPIASQGYLGLAPFSGMPEKENYHGCQPGTTVWNCSHPRDKHPCLGMLRDVPIIHAGYSFTASLLSILESN